MSTPSRWLGYVNMIRYGMIFVRDLDDDLVDRLARVLIRGLKFSAPPETYVDALNLMLREDRGDDPRLIEIAHSREEFHDFIQRVLVRMEELRPWPEPPYLPLDIQRWSELGEAKPIAWIRYSNMDLQPKLVTSFRPLPSAGPPQDGPQPTGAILRLRGGQIVGLLHSGRVREQRTLLLQQDPTADPAATIATFLEVTGLPAEDVVPISDPRPAR